MKYFIGTTNKNPIEYRCNEKIVFSANLYSQDENGEIPCPCPKIKYTLSKDGYGVCDEQLIDGNDAHIELETSLDKPGFCYLKLDACDENGNMLPDSESIMLSAGVEIEKITRAGNEPEDFDKFWERALNELYQVEPEVIFDKELTIPEKDFISRDISIKCAGKMPSSFIITYPRDTVDGKTYPIELIFKGHGFYTSHTICHKDTICVEVNAHGYLNLQNEEYYSSFEHGELQNFGFENNDTPDGCYFKYMILRDIQALRFAMTLPQWDKQHVASTGGSMGGFQATAVAALCSQYVTSLTAYITWMCDIQGLLLEKRDRGWMPDVEDGILYYDSASFAARVKCPVSVPLIAMGDTACTASGLCAFYNAFNTPKNATFYQGNNHAYYMRRTETHTING